MKFITIAYFISPNSTDVTEENPNLANRAFLRHMRTLEKTIINHYVGLVVSGHDYWGYVGNDVLRRSIVKKLQVFFFTTKDIKIVTNTRTGSRPSSGGLLSILDYRKIQYLEKY